jgi:hypothetical protein
MLEYWQNLLELNHWKIRLISIDPDQVTYDSDVPEEDRYFIGIKRDYDTFTADLYYDRELKDEDVIHELLHVRFPNWSEEEINDITKIIIKNERVQNIK